MALSFDLRVSDLNWLFLTLCIVISVVVLFYLFYFGRTLASIISVILRTILWRKYRAWIDIGSVQFSPLGGRLLFRDVRYVGQNQTIRITMGHITWRYWLWRVRQDTDLQKDDTRLPCRTTVKLEGLEWFVYNRGPAFDMLLDQLKKREERQSGTEGPEQDEEPLLPNGLAEKKERLRHRQGSDTTESSSSASLGEQGRARTEHDPASVRIVPPSNDLPTQPKDSDSIDWFREALPIEVQVVKGAVVLGNSATPSLLIAGFKSALGTCGAVKSRSRFDFYKQVYQFSFAKPKIVFRKNHDYREPIEKYGARMQQDVDLQSLHANRRMSTLLDSHAFQRILRRLTHLAERIYTPRPHKPPEPWHGLPRYRAVVGALYDDDSSGLKPADQQYAKASTIYDAGESIDFTYYSDVAGFVPTKAELNGGSNLGAVGLEKPDIGNGDLAPEWGIDLRLNGGTLTYGPWTDRQRAELQRTFFPPGFFDAEPTPRLKPGDRRMHAALKIYIDFSQTTSVRLPTRESSKDWKYDGMQDDRSIIDLGQRAYGWLDVRLGENSSISFVLPMLASEGGFDTFLEVHLDEISLSSSVNYDTFLRSRICRISCQLPQPLKWDDLHTWVISVALEQPEVFLLRDHTFLLVDLIRDWTSGPPASYEHFIPFLYKLDLTIKDYRLNLYLNERNIVDKAAIPQANTLLNLSGPIARISVNVPSIAFAAPFSTLTVGIDADDLSLAVNPPDWNTHAGFMTERTRTVGYVKRTQVTLAQTVYAVVHPDNVETLDVDVELDGVKLQVLGWVIKYFIEIKENYFGNFVHFVTPNEYRSRHADGIQGDPVEEKYRPGKSDIFEVNLNLVGRNSIALLPEEVHDCKSALGISIPEFGVHLRNHDYFMELAVNVDPLELAFIKDCGSSLATFDFPPAEADNRWLLDNLAITSHRLFGPQPRTSVYVAVWEFTIGQLTANLTIPHVNALQRVARAFAANYADKDNALPSAYGIASDPDVIFLSVNMEALDATIWSVDTAVNLLLKDGLSIRLDDLAEDDWLSHVDFDLPSLQLRGLAPTEKDSEEWLEVVAIDTGLSLGLGKTSADYQVLQQRQSKFVQAQDALTKRAAALYSSATQNQHDAGPFDRALHLPPLFAGAIAWAARLDRVKHDFSASEHPRTRRMSERRSVKISDRSVRTFATSDTTSTTYDSLLRRAYRSRRFDSTADNDDGFTFVVVGRDGQLGDVIVEKGIEVQTAKATLRGDPANYKPAELGETLIRVHISLDRPVRAVCSPAAVKVAENIVTCLEKNTTAEHWLDDLGADYGGLVVAKEEIKPSTATSAVQVTASIASIQLRLVQDILRPGDIDMAEQLDGEHPSDSAILSTTHISIKSISASFLRTFATDHYPAISLRQTGTLRTGKVRLQVRHATDMVSDRRSRLVDFGVPGSVDGTVLDLSVDGMGSQVRLQSDETRFGLDIAESNMSFVSSATELITGTVHSWFIVSRAIETAVLRAHYQPLWRYRHLFATILQKGQQEQIFADPPFLNRPTIVLLRQRADMGWRVLAHVRHSYRHLSHTAKNSIREAFSDPTEVSEAADYAVLMPLLQEWYGWDLEKEQIAQLGLFRHLFPTYCKPVPRPSRHARESIDGLPGGEQPRRATAEPVISWETAIKARISTLTAMVQFFEERGCKNRLVLTPCEVISAYGGKLPGETQDLKTRIILGNLAVELDPALLRLVRHVARVRKVFEVKLAPLLPRPRAHAAPIQPEAPKVQPVRQVTVAGPRNLPVFASLVFESIDVSTQAQGVRASLTLNKINACIDPTLHLHQEYGTVLSLDGSAFLGCDSIRILAATESKAKLDSQRTSPGSTLASMQLQDVHTHALLRDLSDGGLKILLTSIIGSSRIRIPRSILRMSQFVEHWREDSLPQSKVAFEELRKDLEKERSASPPRPVPSSMPAEPGSRIVLDANLAIPLVTCHIRAAQKLWLDYSVGEILLHARTHLLGTQLKESEAGLRIGDQSVSFIAVSDSERLGEPLPFGGDSIKLPAFHGSVGYSNQELEVLASLERISVILTVDVLDSALAVQNRFEQDIDELLSVLSKRKAAKSAKGEMSATPAGVLADKQEPPRLTKWKAQLALKGLNLGLRGPLSTQYIGADLVDGFIRQDLAGGIQETRWEVSASNLALSLAQQTSVSSPRLPLAGSTGSASTFDRSYRLAYFVLDVHAGNQVSYISELPQITENKDASHLHLRIPKLHAVMQTAAIEALDELIEHFSSEIALRRKARAAELASIKEKVIQTFEIPEKAAPPKVLPWIERCVLSLRIESVGVAIPLEDIEIAAPWFGHRLESTSRTRPAFLLSAPSILFATSRATAGFASIANLSAQFVQSFDQTKPEHFSGLQHATQNRLLFPHAQLTIASDKASAAKMKAFTVRARMSGAELDIDPTIVNSTFALLDLYEIGYKRFARYTLEAKAAKEAQEEARDEAVPSAVADAESQTEQPESLPSFIDTTTFEASFVVDSGIINMHGTSSRHMESKDRSQQSPKKPGRPEPPRRGHSLSHKASIGLQPPSTGQSTSLAPDSFVIPKFTMWAIKREARQAGEQNNIHLDAIIHSSRNTLYPTLLPFLSEASDAVKGRMQHNKPLQVAEPDWVAETANPDNLPGVTASSQQAQPVIQPSGIRNLRITFSLRIDRSRLEISCLQAAQVSAVLNWQSGGLLIAVQPGSRKLEVSARVDEVGFEIRHTFSPERCIGGSAQNLILALSFAPYSESQTLLSGSFDASSITGDVNFRQLQDFLCFKAVWLDRLGQLVPLPDENTAPSEQVIAPHKVQQTTVLVVIVAARLREVKLTLMLGQSIGTVELKASELVARLRQVPNDSKSVGLDLQSFAITSRGRLSGYYNTSGLSLESTIRDIGGPLDELDGSHVKLGAVVGQMDGALEFDYRKVMLIESDPIRVAVTDEWTASRTDTSRLQLHFSLVFGSVNVIMTTQTVPILVKLVDDLERLIEDRRVKARNALFGSSGLLPDVKIVKKGKSIADARKAAIAPKPAGGRDSSRSTIPAGTVVLGDIQLEAERLRLAIFLHHFTDQEAFRGDAGSIQARLERAVDGSGSVGRDLHLRLGFFSVRRLRPKPVSPNQEREFTITEWLDLLRAAPERNIFKAPSAEVRMKSTQAAHSHELHHRFSLKYVGTLDVSLNWAMLKQLGELLNAYKEGMRRIRQTDNRTAPSTPALDAAVAASDALNGSGVSEAKAEPAVESDGKTTDKDTAVKKVAGEDIPAPPTVSAMGSLQYISPPGGIEIHNPQLTMLGDATPPLDWFGVKQGLYPGWVHEGVTVLLEKILLELSDVYQKTLERNAC